MATCYRHSSRETGVSCSNCGRPICPDCMTPTPVGMRCPECARERTPVRTIRDLTMQASLTRVLIGINVVAWVAELATGRGGVLGGGTVFEYGALNGPGVAAGEYWRLVTSGFLHSNQMPFGLLHIGFNMYLLYVLGQMIEPSVGHLRFAALYAVSLLGGAFGALLLSPDASTVGASGAVFGLMGGALVLMRARGIDPMQSGIPLLILLNLVLSLRPGISIGGHVGGLIGGLAAAFALVELGERRGSRALPLVACAVLAVAAVVGSIAVVA